MLDAMDNLRKPKYPWCSDSTDHISNDLKRNMEKQRQSYFDCFFFSVDCGQFMVQAQSPEMYFNLLHHQDSENHLEMAGHFTIKMI